MAHPDDSKLEKLLENQKLLENLLEKTPSDKVRESFIKKAGLEDQDKEIENNDKQDNYDLRKACKQGLQKILIDLPPKINKLLWCIVIVIGLLLFAATFYIVKDKNILLTVIFQAIWSIVVSGTTIAFQKLTKQ